MAEKVLTPDFLMHLAALVRLCASHLTCTHHLSLHCMLQQIDRGRRESRRTDISGIRNHIGQWPSLNWQNFPRHRHDMGFRNKETGAYLCPADKDWSDPEYVTMTFLILNLMVCSVHTTLRDGLVAPGACDIPRLCWAGNTPNPEDYFDGFFRSLIIVLVSLPLNKVRNGHTT